jgi:peroxiredoxin
MSKLGIGDKFPAAILQDTNRETVELPNVFSKAPASVIFFYRGRW